MLFNAYVSLLVFCLDDISIDESEILKCFNYCVSIIVSLSTSPFMLLVFAYILRCSYVGCIYIYNCYIFLD